MLVRPLMKLRQGNRSRRPRDSILLAGSGSAGSTRFGPQPLGGLTSDRTLDFTEGRRGVSVAFAADACGTLDLIFWSILNELDSGPALETFSPHKASVPITAHRHAGQLPVPHLAATAQPTTTTCQSATPHTEAQTPRAVIAPPRRP